VVFTLVVRTNPYGFYIAVAVIPGCYIGKNGNIGTF